MLAWWADKGVTTLKARHYKLVLLLQEASDYGLVQMVRLSIKTGGSGQVGAATHRDTINTSAPVPRDS